MLSFLKKNIFITVVFIFALSLGFITFFTFIDKSFIRLNDENLQILLLSNLVAIILLFVMIFYEIKKTLKNDIDTDGSKSNKRYITFFSLFTIIPSILISLFSLFLLSNALNKYLDKKVTTAVNNSYEIAKSYTEEVKTKTQSEIILIAYDLNKSVNFLLSNLNQFKSFLQTQKLIRNVDEIHIIDGEGKIYLSTLKDFSKYLPPFKEAIEMVSNDDRPLKIINAYENISASIIKITSLNDRYLYIVKYLDVKIAKYLTQSEEALNFYYTVENKQTGIKISFIFVYLIIVSLLLFLSISIAIKFSSRFFRSINNLIIASSNISKGDLNIKVPELKTDKDLEILNKNFNNMIDRLKTQQEKLIINERHEAWGNLARKLAHEIKNPLTPIQLTIDRLKNKYSDSVIKSEKENFQNNLKMINKQINQIENLVNEFSDFARMPKPILKDNDLIMIINDNVKLISELDKSVEIEIKNNNNEIYFNCDNEQISRVFFNLIKNSFESIHEKTLKNIDFIKKVSIEILNNKEHIVITIIDNGVGFKNFSNITDILTPYFTTKKKGTGLGLSIVNKIINDHNGKLKFIPLDDGAKVSVEFFKNGN